MLVPGFSATPTFDSILKADATMSPEDDPNLPASLTTSSQAAPTLPANRTSHDRRFARGLIGLLLVVAMIEAIAHVRMMVMSQRLWNELQKGERERSDVTRAEINAVMKRPPDESFTVKKPVGEENYDAYRFWGLIKQRELYVHYGVQGIRSPQEAIEILTTLPDEVRNKR